MAKRRNNVVKFTRRPDINIGLILFIVIFIYIIISVLIFAFSKKTTIYEVNAGSLTNDSSYTGFILREETIVKSPYSGNVNYFLSSGKRASIGTIIYSVDETGRVYDKIKSATEEVLDSKDIAGIKDMFTDFSSSYDPSDYKSVYSVRQQITNKIAEYQSNKISQQLDEYISETESTDFFHPVEADKTGLVSYVTDGYENTVEEQISEAFFDTDSYSNVNLQNTELINQGDSAYKLVTSDVWYIYIPLNETEHAALADVSSININFTGRNIECTGAFSVITLDGKAYGRIKLTKYMANFIDERFVQIEIYDCSVSGLKIPISSVFNKSFYTIPKEYLTPSGTFIVRYYDEYGQIATKAVEAEVYEESEQYYYVSMSTLESGDILMLPDSDETYVVGTMDELSGVYCVNKGYAVFKKVDILDNNEEYYIIRKGNHYGLAIYDHIVLDYTTVKENEIVN